MTNRTILLPPRPCLVTRQARAKVKHTQKARPSPAEARERPRYRALAQGIARQEQAVHRAVTDLRRRWFAAVGLDDPAKAAKNLPVEDLRQVDAAIEAFLTTMAGPARGSGFGFAQAPEGLVQETNILAHRIGTARGAEQVGSATPNLELTRIQRQWLLERSFERLSEDGRLRFETRLDAIRDRMLTMFEAGENPLKIARELGRDLDGYEQGRLRQIVRTEAAFASEAAIAEEYRAAGVRQYEVAGDPTTDSLCTDFQEGGPYDLNNEEARPPFHPNCFCSQIPSLD